MLAKRLFLHFDFPCPLLGFGRFLPLISKSGSAILGRSPAFQPLNRPLVVSAIAQTVEEFQLDTCYRSGADRDSRGSADHHRHRISTSSMAGHHCSSGVSNRGGNDLNTANYRRSENAETKNHLCAKNSGRHRALRETYG